MSASILLIAFSLLLPTLVDAQATSCVETKEELEETLQAAKSGDEICIANGVYQDMEITVNKDNIILKGQEGGGVILKGRSRIKINGKGITVKNFEFTAPLKEGYSRRIPTPIEFWYKSENCSVYDCMIHNHAADIWVKVRGINNQLHHCTFKDKPAPELSPEGKELRISNIVSVSDKGMSRIHIHHNRFINYDPDALEAKHKHGSAEAVYVKLAKKDKRDTRNLDCVVNNNYFYKIDSEEETIGIKSSGNQVFENAIEDCYGGISLRHGKNNVARGNFIQARKTKSKNDYGINVYDENHIVKNNWIMDVGQFHGIRISSGDGPFDCDFCRVRAKNVKVLNNTLVNSALHLGRKFRKGPYSAPALIEIQDLTISTSENYAMIDGYGLDKQNAFPMNRYAFTGKNHFYGTKLAYTKVKRNLQSLINQGRITWSRKVKDLGNHGTKMIMKIKCAAGTSWEDKLPDC